LVIVVVTQLKIATCGSSCTAGSEVDVLIGVAIEPTRDVEMEIRFFRYILSIATRCPRELFTVTGGAHVHADGSLALTREVDDEGSSTVASRAERELRFMDTRAVDG
jgi:hypothetical protein